MRPPKRCTPRIHDAKQHSPSHSRDARRRPGGVLVKTPLMSEDVKSYIITSLSSQYRCRDVAASGGLLCQLPLPRSPRRLTADSRRCRNRCALRCGGRNGISTRRRRRAAARASAPHQRTARPPAPRRYGQAMLPATSVGRSCSSAGKVVRVSRPRAGTARMQNGDRFGRRPCAGRGGLRKRPGCGFQCSRAAARWVATSGRRRRCGQTTGRDHPLTSRRP